MTDPRIGAPAYVFARGIDSLYIHSDTPASDDLLARCEAITDGLPAALPKIGGFRWDLRGRWRQWTYMLVEQGHELFYLAIDGAKPMPTVRMQVSALACWMASPDELVAMVWRILGDLAGLDDWDKLEGVRVGRVDMAVDFGGWVPPRDPARWVGRHRTQRAVVELFDDGPDHWSGLRLGKLPGVQVAVYDKTLEIQRASAKTWMAPIWTKGGRLDEDRVWRLEVRLGSKALRKLPEIRRFPRADDGEVLAWMVELGAAWRRIVGEDRPWIRCVVPGRARARRRETEPAWRVLQRAWGAGPRAEWEDVRAAGVQAAKGLVRQAVGCIVGAARALEPTLDPDDAPRAALTRRVLGAIIEDMDVQPGLVELLARYLEVPHEDERSQEDRPDGEGLDR